jgi:hypothetical protein
VARRLLAGLLVAVVSSLSPLATARAAAVESCACVKAACCCAPKRPASGHGCHGDAADAHGTAIRCHHTTDALALTSTTGALPAPVALKPALRRAAASEVPAAAPRDGFSRLYAPPPRLLAS